MGNKLLMTDRQMFAANQGGFFVPEWLAVVVVFYFEMGRNWDKKCIDDSSAQ